MLELNVEQKHLKSTAFYLRADACQQIISTGLVKIKPFITALPESGF